MNEPTRETREQTIAALQKSYAMELESVANYLAASVNPEGVVAEPIKQALAEDVMEELGHARKLAARIKQLGGAAPSSAELKFNLSELAPQSRTEDVRQVVSSVIADETAACDQYRWITEFSEGKDPVTQDLCTKLLADEEAHRAKFVGFQAEFEED